MGTIEENSVLHPFWLEELGGGRLRLGLSESWLETLTAEPVGLELAPPGTRLARGDTLGFLHLAERVHDLRAPAALEVLAVNEAAEADARLVRLSPYERGWLIEARLSAA